MSEQCSKMLWRHHYYQYQCLRKGVVCRDGKWYCKQHEPGNLHDAKIWWRARFGYRPQIDPVQIVSESKAMVQDTDGFRYRKDTEGEWYRPTFEEAKECLENYLAEKISEQQSRLEYLEKQLDTVRNLVEPITALKAREESKGDHNGHTA